MMKTDDAKDTHPENMTVRRLEFRGTCDGRSFPVTTPIQIHVYTNLEGYSAEHMQDEGLDEQLRL